MLLYIRTIGFLLRADMENIGEKADTNNILQTSAYFIVF